MSQDVILIVHLAAQAQNMCTKAQAVGTHTTSQSQGHLLTFHLVDRQTFVSSAVQMVSSTRMHNTRKGIAATNIQILKAKAMAAKLKTAPQPNPMTTCSKWDSR